MSKVAELKAKLGRAEDAQLDALFQVRMVQGELRKAMLAETPRKASDYRLRIIQDDSSFTSEQHMLDDVFGDCWMELDDDDNMVGLTEYAKEYVEAWNNGSGIYSWGGVLEEKDPVTGEWVEGDSCFGFYSLDGCAPEKDIAEMVLNVPEGVNEADVEIVYSDD